MWVHNINGVLMEMERDRPSLKKNAIPSKNLEIFVESRGAKRKANYVTKAYEKYKVIEVVGEIDVDDMKNIQEIEEKIAAITEGNTTTEESEEIEALETDDGENILLEVTNLPKTNENDNLNQVISEKDDSKEGLKRIPELTGEVLAEIIVPKPSQKTICIVSEMKRRADFESMYDEIFTVTLPSQLWGVHRCPEQSYIAFSRFSDTLMQSDLVVFIDPMWNYKISYRGFAVKDGTLCVMTEESMTHLLDETESAKYIYSEASGEVKTKRKYTKRCEEFK